MRCAEVSGSSVVYSATGNSLLTPADPPLCTISGGTGGEPEREGPAQFRSTRTRGRWRLACAVRGGVPEDASEAVKKRAQPQRAIEGSRGIK